MPKDIIISLSKIFDPRAGNLADITLYQISRLKADAKHVTPRTESFRAHRVLD